MAINFAATQPSIPVIALAVQAPAPLRRAGEQIIERPVTDSPESELRSGEELASAQEERRLDSASERRSRTEDDRGDEETAVGRQVDILI